MNFIKKMFSKTEKQIEVAPIKAQEKYVQEYSKEAYNFQTITVADILEKKEAIWDLYTNKSDGFLIKNFLSEQEVDAIMSNFDNVLNDKPAYTHVGFTYPPVFAEFSNQIREQAADEKEEATKAYFQKNTAYNSNFGNVYAIDVRERFESLFKSLSGGRDIVIADGMGGLGQYPFSTFRYLTPEVGLMSVHCGNYFGKTFENFYKDLTKKVAVENQMSFFIMLQEPDAGGELSLFNFRWKNGQTKVDPSEDNEIIQPDGSKMYVEDDANIIKDKIDPKKGDMILFQGGNIWHRVEMVKGTKPRITFGGFIGISIDKTKFYYWS
jgi:hapalindole-type alkaloid chlorinase